jgi:hypothetical protein
MKGYLEVAHRILEEIEPREGFDASPEIDSLVEGFRLWPPSRGRDGLLRDPAAVWSAIGCEVRRKVERDRIGKLFAVSFDCRSGELRCRLRFSNGREVMAWPEEIEIEDGTP